MPPWKLPRSIFSFGACAFSSGNPTPKSTAGTFSSSWNVDTTGIEQGFPGLVTQLFVGLFAPAGTPQPILDQIERATRGAMEDNDLQAKLTAAGFETVTDSSPAKAAQYLQAEITRWTPVLKASGMKAE